MSLQGPSDRILVVLDLDSTHFNSHIKNDVVWIGDKNKWLNCYLSLKNFALTHNAEIIFSVVTNKQFVDDIVIEAAQAFRPLFESHNPSMYSVHNQQTMALIEVNGELSYESLVSNDSVKSNIPDGAYSNFIIAYEKPKSIFILKMAERYQISPQQCILLDDLDDVLIEVEEKGIKTISYACFNDQKASAEQMQNKEYVCLRFNDNAKLLFNTVNQILQNIQIACEQPEKLFDINRSWVPAHVRSRVKSIEVMEENLTTTFRPKPILF